MSELTKTSSRQYVLHLPAITEHRLTSEERDKCFKVAGQYLDEGKSVVVGE